MQLRQRARPAPPGVRGRKGCGHLNYSPAASPARTPAPRVFPSAKGQEWSAETSENRGAGRTGRMAYISSAVQEWHTRRFRFTGSRQLLLLENTTGFDQQLEHLYIFNISIRKYLSHHMMDEVSK